MEPKLVNKIVIDLDNTLFVCDWQSKFGMKPEEFSEFYDLDAYFLPNDLVSDVREMFKDPEFYQELPCMSTKVHNGAKIEYGEIQRVLSERGFDIIFATARPITALDVTTRALYRMGFSNPKVVFATGAKESVFENRDVFAVIEDNPNVIEMAVKHGVRRVYAIRNRYVGYSTEKVESCQVTQIPTAIDALVDIAFG